MRAAAPARCCRDSSATRRIAEARRAPQPQHRMETSSTAQQPLVFVVFGPSGCGKTTVAALLAQRLEAQFIDADEHHSAANIRKMSAGTPLTDEDRWPWLQTLAGLLREQLARNAPAVLACSALKASYRDVLRGAADRVACTSGGGAGSSSCSSGACDAAAATETAGGATNRVAFVLLLPGRAELVARLQARAASGGHFMPPSLLDSQLAQLELPPDEHLAWRFEGDVLPPPGDIVNTILAGRRDG